jgi:hypothetical protein
VNYLDETAALVKIQLAEVIVFLGKSAHISHAISTFVVWCLHNRFAG